MAKRKFPVAAVEFKPVEDNRPVGALRYADPSTAELPRHIHTFNQPESHGKRGGTQDGIRSVTGDLVQYCDRRGVEPEWSYGKPKGDALWSAMNKKRGVFEAEDE